MRYWGIIALLTQFVYVCERVYSCDCEKEFAALFQTPNMFLGNADADGRFVFFEDLCNVPFGETDLPFRIVFSPGAGGRGYLGAWKAPMLESNALMETERLLRINLLGGGVVHLSKVGERFETSDKEWIAIPDGDTLRVTTDKVELLYRLGQLEKVTLIGPDSKEYVYTWRYNNRLPVAIINVANKPILEAEYSGVELKNVSIGGRSWKFGYGQLPRITEQGKVRLISELLNNMESITGPSGGVTEYKFATTPSLDNTLSVTHQGQAVGNFEWDPLTNKIIADGRSKYVSVTQGKQQKITRKFSDAEYEEWSFDSGAGTVEFRTRNGEKVRRHYFMSGGPWRMKLRRLERLVEGKFRTEYSASYDDKGRLIREISDVVDNPWVFMPHNGKALQYSYDSKGNRTSMSIDGTPAWAKQYDGDGRLRETKDFVNGSVVKALDSGGREQQVQYPDGSTQIRTFNSSGELIQIKYTE